MIDKQQFKIQFNMDPRRVPYTYKIQDDKYSEHQNQHIFAW